MNKFYIFMIAILVCVLSPFNAQADEPSGSPLLVYKPPTRGAPASRIGGGTRGVSDDIPSLIVMAPDHTGLTSKAKPVVYWYMSKPMVTRLELTVINDEDINPVFEGNVNAPTKSGIQRFSFEKHGISLKPGVEYRWYVSFSSDPENRSQDVIAGGTIQRTELPGAIMKKLKGASDQQKLAILAEQGIWYDAIDLLARMIEKNPGDEQLKKQRAAFFKQVGLSEMMD